MEGNILLVSTNSFKGRQIRRISRSNYNHVALFIEKDKIIESKVGSGVIITPIEYYQKLQEKNKLTFDIYRFKSPLTEDQWKIIKSFVLKQVGRKYDILQLLSLLIFFVFHINRQVEPIDIEKAFICSELIGKACDRAGIVFTDEIDLDNLTPKDIETSNIIEKI